MGDDAEYFMEMQEGAGHACPKCGDPNSIATNHPPKRVCFKCNHTETFKSLEQAQAAWKELL